MMKFMGRMTSTFYFAGLGLLETFYPASSKTKGKDVNGSS
jgi:hypothetical protein